MTIGFVAGLAVVYGMDSLVEACVDDEEDDDEARSTHRSEKKHLPREKL